MADMLLRARFDNESGMVSEDEDVGVDFFEAAHLATEKGNTPTLNDFNESEYDGEWLQIGRFLKTMTPTPEWTREEAGRIRKKAYRFFLRDRHIWRHPKKKNGVQLRLVTKREEQELLVAFHESPWAGHCGMWATFEKLTGRYR
jgi:lipocalin